MNPENANLSEALTDICDIHNVFGSDGLDIRGKDFVALLVDEAERWAERGILLLRDLATAAQDMYEAELEYRLAIIVTKGTPWPEYARAELARDRYMAARRALELHESWKDFKPA